MEDAIGCLSDDGETKQGKACSNDVKIFCIMFFALRL